MNPIMWKDLKILNKKRGMLIFSLALGMFLALILNVAALSSKENTMMKVILFNKNFSYLAILLPMIVGYTIAMPVFLSEVGEGSIEAMLALPISVKKILISKLLLVSSLSCMIGEGILLISMVISWFVFYHMIICPPMNMFINIFLSFPLFFGVYGLVEVGYWILPKVTTMSIISTLLFIGIIYFMNAVPYLIPSLAGWLEIILLVITALLDMIFYRLLTKVNKEKVALSRL